MKQYIFFLLCIMLTTVANEQKKLCSLCIEPTWQYLDNREHHFKDRWILVGSIIFKKKCAEPVVISKVHLRWHGDPIDQLQASLYIKKEEKFLAIQENLICDGHWNQVKQKLILKFPEPYKLPEETTFYLVLTVPEQLEPVLRNGSFSVEPHCLPSQVQQACGTSNLVLSLSAKTKEPLA